MIVRRAALAGMIVTFALVGSSAPSAATSAQKRAMTAQEPQAATLSAGNGIYTVDVADSGSTGIYTATTGSSHPAGNGLNVFYGGGSPGTTFNSIRSYTTSTDYTQIGGRSSVNPTVFLGPFGSVTPIGSTGFRTTYTLPGGLTTPDKLTIISDVNVNGTTLDDSSISVTTRVQNDGLEPVQIGIRYLWDYEIGSDDGPTFQALTPDGPVLLTEAEFDPPTFVQYRIVDNGIGSPTFFVFGTATGPSSLIPKPTIPDRLQYASWPNSIGTAFDYSVNTSRDIASGGGIDDSSAIYYFGPTQQSAITIPAGGSASVTALAFLSSSPIPPTGGGGIQAPALGTWGLGFAVGLMLMFGFVSLRRRGSIR